MQNPSKIIPSQGIYISSSSFDGLKITISPGTIFSAFISSSSPSLITIAFLFSSPPNEWILSNLFFELIIINIILITSTIIID